VPRAPHRKQPTRSAHSPRREHADPGDSGPLPGRAHTVHLTASLPHPGTGDSVTTAPACQRLRHSPPWQRYRWQMRITSPPEGDARALALQSLHPRQDCGHRASVWATPGATADSPAAGQNHAQPGGGPPAQAGSPQAKRISADPWPGLAGPVIGAAGLIHLVLIVAGVIAGVAAGGFAGVPPAVVPCTAGPRPAPCPRSRELRFRPQRLMGGRPDAAKHWGEAYTAGATRAQPAPAATAHAAADACQRALRAFSTLPPRATHRAFSRPVIQETRPDRQGDGYCSVSRLPVWRLCPGGRRARRAGMSGRPARTAVRRRVSRE
jgi:hypothetical protein